MHAFRSRGPDHLRHAFTNDLKSLFLFLLDLIDLLRHTCNVSTSDNACQEFPSVRISNRLSKTVEDQLAVGVRVVETNLFATEGLLCPD